MILGSWKKVKKLILPVTAMVTTGVFYLHRSFFGRQAANLAITALSHPGTSMMALMICTDPMVFWVSSNLAIILWRGTWSIISKHFSSD
jgi:hypothetical protein